MRKVELPLAKGRRRDSKKPSLMVKKDGMILKKQHRRAVTSFPFMVKGKAWLGIKDPPVGEEQVGQKLLFL